MSTTAKIAKKVTCSWKKLWLPPINLWNVPKQDIDMAHPLDIKLSELTDDQLSDRISMLYARLKFFYGNGNVGVINQLQLFLDEAILEQNLRSERMMQGYDQSKKKD
jgi:hypothetical protein